MPQHSGRDRHNMWAEMPPSKKRMNAEAEKQQSLQSAPKNKSDKKKKQIKKKQTVSDNNSRNQHNAAGKKVAGNNRTNTERKPEYLPDDSNIAKPIDLQAKVLKRKTDSRKTRSETDEQAKRRKRSWRSYILYYIMFGIVAVVLFCILSTTVLFNVSKITVKGETVYQSADVIDLCGVELGENLVRMDADEIEKKLIDELPYIDKVKVNKLYLSTTLEIVLNQATPLANIQYKDRYYLISGNGRIMDSELETPSDSCVTVTGFNPEFAVSGDFIKVADEGGRNYLTKLLKCVKQEAELLKEDDGSAGSKPDILYDLIDAYRQVGFDGTIQHIDINNIYQIKLTYDNRIVFNLGEIKDAKIKLTIAKNLIDKGEFDGEKGDLDLSMAADPSNMKVTFRPVYDDSKPSETTPDSEDKPDNSTSSPDDNTSSDEPVIGETTPVEE